LNNRKALRHWKRLLGRHGERKACAYLKKHGYRILSTNFRCKAGEIDIVAADKETLVFVEVKTRSSDQFGTPQEAVTSAKLRTLRRVAYYYLLEEGAPDIPVRFDILALTIDQNSRVRNIEHFPNVGEF
jgi:putative endonuclease